VTAAPSSYSVVRGEWLLENMARQQDTHVFDGALPRDTSRTVEGEDLMQGFIRHHMTSILHPFADHVKDLQEQTHDLGRQLADGDAKSAQAEVRLGQHDQKLLAMWTSLAQTNARLESTQLDLQKSIEDRVKLEADHAVTKALLGRTGNGITNFKATIDDLQKLAESNQEKIKQLEKCVYDLEGKGQEQETDKSDQVGNLHSNLDRLKDICDKLQHRTNDIAQSLQNTSQLSDSNREGLSDLVRAIDQQKKEDARVFTMQTEHLNSLEAMLGDTNRNVAGQAEHLKSVAAEVELLKPCRKQCEEIEPMKAQQNGMKEVVNKHMERIGTLEDVLSSHKQETEKELSRLAELDMEKDTRVRKSAAEIQDLEAKVKGHTERLHPLERRTAGLQDGHQKMGDQLSNHESDMRAMKAAQQASLSRLDQHGTELDKANMCLQNHQRNLDNARGDLEGLRADLGGATDNMGRLSSRLDLCHNYFSGLSKGFQDTHRHIVSGEGGFLPPKSPSGTATGALPVLASVNGRPVARKPATP